MGKKPPLVFVVGPTASGKSSLALELAQKFNGEIINGDSLQVYKSLDIGTAKPSLEERSLCPHHLFDFIEDGGSFTAGDYRRKALEVLDSISGLPIIVGGSGFYLQALEKGMFEAPEVSEELKLELNKELEEKGLQALYKELENCDPEWARNIEPQDTYRTMRGLSIFRAHGVKLSKLRKQFDEAENSLAKNYNIIKLGVKRERPELKNRVTDRLAIMLNQGFEREVYSLLDKGLGKWPPLASVGYKEMVAFIEGQIDVEERDQEIIKNTMRLAKRQMTWFRRDPLTCWLEGESMEDEALKLVKSQLP